MARLGYCFIIPRYLDSFETSTGFCLVQEYKKAPSLTQPRHFTPSEIKEIALAVLEVLVYLQRQQPPVIHRDIKPENILVDRSQKIKVYLVDFGFARIGGGDVAISSVVKGTLGFMPPEQMFNRQLTEASDLYSLGVTLICLLTKIPSTQIGTLIDEGYNLNFKQRLPKLNPQLVQWLEKMTALSLKNRYPNGAIALEALTSIDVNDTKPRLIKPQIGQLTIFIVTIVISLVGIAFTGSRREAPVKIENHSLPVTVETYTPNSSQTSFTSGQAIPFHISSLNSDFAYAGTFDGEYRIYPSFIEIMVKKGTIYLRDNSSYKGRRNINSVIFGIGYNLPQGGWSMINSSQHLPVNRVMKPGDSYTFTSAYFVIPKVRSADLSQHWLVANIAGIDIDSQDQRIRRTFAHSDRNIFAWIPPSPKPISPTSSNLNTPTLISPINGTVFNHYPRETRLEWSAVPGAESYTVEIDIFDRNQWASDFSGKTYHIVPWLTTTSLTTYFVGAQPGRWRVWAVGPDGRESPKSDWWEFRYTR